MVVINHAMSNLVLYRKYRPKTFGEISGQQHIVQTLANAIKNGQLAHAYLFCGPRGTGKTTMARLVAKAANCEALEKNDFEPCNKCTSCQSIANGNALDVIEIDAASNRGVNEIRELREGVQFAPTALKHKVFIIDEVHMLTKEAFNALLKTLEEPPSHVMFVLATTESSKVPATILSRCQRFDFRKLSIEDIVDRLKKLAKKEELKCDDDVIRFIATISDGGLRDAESLLGQVISISGKNIDLETVQDVLGVADMKDIHSFVDLLVENNSANVFKFVNELHSKGKDIGEFVRSASNYLRKMMVCQIDNSLVNVVAKDMTKEQQANLCAQASKMDKARLHKVITKLIEAESSMKRSFAPIIPLELAIFDIFEI